MESSLQSIVAEYNRNRGNYSALSENSSVFSAEEANPPNVTQKVGKVGGIRRV